ncbi:Modification methylase HphIA [Stagonosporopsis vannaccii]|nr:Modification methylase HphIA [Stagonosporopsis vannaccii]
MSASSPYYILDDDDDAAGTPDSDVELLDYDSDSTISGDEAPGNSSRSHTANRKQYSDAEIPNKSSICPPDIELQIYRLAHDLVIQPGDTVELVDHSKQEPEAMHSGSFLRIKHIIKDLKTDDVRLRGYVLLRTKYIGQIFDWKRNELALTLRVRDDDQRNPFAVGMEDVSVQEVLRKRDCIFTNKRFPLQSFRYDPRFTRFPIFTTKQEAVRRIFYDGPLCCRVTYIRFTNRTGKDSSGIIRHLHSDEIDNPGPSASSAEPGLSPESSVIIEDDEEEDAVILTASSRGRGKQRARSPSLEILESLPNQKLPCPTKRQRYTFGDVFCGAGGATRGAVQAGLHVRWGLDIDEDALNTYHLNHPGALPFCQNAHNFPPAGFNRAELRVDHLHLSPPCCYWSPAHTHSGRNDQANYEAIYTVGPILRTIKPRIATLEQTFGLMTHEEHQQNFKMLLNDIGNAGYDLRYKLQDMSKLGLVQKRKRLLIIAARRRTPLPPFPEDTHGEPGSGLKPFVFIDNALKVMSRLGPRALNDEHHQPKPMGKPKPAYDPHGFLKGCITTSGGDNYHYDGKRRYTVREMALFQTFPYDYQFSGTRTQAMKQVGNAFPPAIAEAIFKNVAMTLEAFDEGLIGAEDDLTDPEGVFAQLRLNAWRSFPAPQELCDGTADANDSPEFRPGRENAEDDDEEVVFLGSTNAHGTK